MCRLLAYAGAPCFLDSLLIEPAASLIAQSLGAREAKTVVNADGCGIGWYGEREEPGVYRGVLPAWSDGNLHSLCRQIRSGLFAAHIRSATTGEVSAANCHPFAVGRHLFMHNGQIGGYERVRRRVDALIPDDLYVHRRGNGDSEAIFLAALARGLDRDPVRAMASTLGEILGILRAAGVAKPLRFAAVHVDGMRLRCFRWSSDGRPPLALLAGGGGGARRRVGALRHRGGLACCAPRQRPDALRGGRRGVGRLDGGGLSRRHEGCLIPAVKDLGRRQARTRAAARAA